ncbi:MAG: hypothetical protein JXA41_14860 [Deltaproteobacteria bacterium]|nr:hypothetical protein [Deltaproteobacteria bacterium]
MLQLIDFLKAGMDQSNHEASTACANLCRLWPDCEAQAVSLNIRDKRFLDGLKRSFFGKIKEKIENNGLKDVAFLDDETLTGYVYIQTGHYDHAVKILQACLMSCSESISARVLGYLGDVYVLRGDPPYARKYYLEAFLLDPLSVDWCHFKDGDLLALKRCIEDDEQFEPEVAAHWLPSYAYVQGIFGAKIIQQLDVIRGLVQDYTNLVGNNNDSVSPENCAKIFIRSIILCDNEPFLKMVKYIDFAEIRWRMREINPHLFSDYLKCIEKKLRKV